MTMRDSIVNAMNQCESDFNLTDTLCRKTGIPRRFMVGCLDELWREGVIRHPWGWHGQEVDWWRLVDRGLTKGEKRRRLMAIIGTSRISDGSYSGGNF